MQSNLNQTWGYLFFFFWLEILSYLFFKKEVNYNLVFRPILVVTTMIWTLVLLLFLVELLCYFTHLSWPPLGIRNSLHHFTEK